MGEIDDFNCRCDSFQLDNSVLTQLGRAAGRCEVQDRHFRGITAAQDAEHQIIYDRSRGYLYYHKDHASLAVQMKIATLTKAKLTCHGFYVI